MPLPDRAALRTRIRREGPQIARIVIAACIGWQVCKWIVPTDNPIYAALVPLVAMRDQPFSALNVSFDRVLGVIAGVVLGVLLVTFLGPGLLAVGLAVGVGLLLGMLFRLGPNLNFQASLSALLVFSYPNPDQFAINRVWETLVGAAVTILLSPVLFPPDAAAAFRRAFRSVSQEIGDRLADLLVLAESAPAHPDRLAQLHEAAGVTEAHAERLPGDLESALRAVKVNPLRRKDRAPLEQMVGPTHQLVELARVVHTLIEEVQEVSAHPHMAEAWPATARALVRSVRPVTAVVSGRLAVVEAGPHTPTGLHTAAAALGEWRTADPRPLAVVLRRPVYRLIVGLAVIVDVPAASLTGLVDESSNAGQA